MSPYIEFRHLIRSCQIMDLTNKIAFVSGGARGIGFDLAKSMLQSGAKRVYLMSRRQTIGMGAVKSLNETFNKDCAEFIEGNIMIAEEFEHAIRYVVEKSGQVDIFVNNAGVGECKNAIEINLIGTLNGTRLAMKYMSIANGGHGGLIINISSIFGFKWSSFLPRYVASKWGIIGLSKSYGMPRYYDSSHVRVMVICPGCTTTVMTTKFDMTAILTELNNHGVDNIFQETDYVSGKIVEIIKSDQENGSIWVIENNHEPYKMLEMLK